MDSQALSNVQRPCLETLQLQSARPASGLLPAKASHVQRLFELEDIIEGCKEFAVQDPTSDKGTSRPVAWSRMAEVCLTAPTVLPSG